MKYADEIRNDDDDPSTLRVIPDRTKNQSSGKHPNNNKTDHLSIHNNRVNFP